MRMSIATAAGLLLFAAAHASAQSVADSPGASDPQARAQSPRFHKSDVAPGVRAGLIFDIDKLAAAKSFDATIGTSRLMARGFAVEGTGLWRGAFARIAMSSAGHDGSRVFVYNGTVFPLNIPFHVDMAPFEFGGGWRFGVPDAPVVLYAGISLVRLHYQETSSFAGPDENVDAHFSGTAFFGGIDINAVDYLAISLEAQMRRIPNAIGAGGVSVDFKEANLGGLTIRILIGFRFTKK